MFPFRLFFYSSSVSLFLFLVFCGVASLIPVEIYLLWRLIYISTLSKSN